MRPLLHGRLELRPEQGSSGEPAARIRVRLWRAIDEAARNFWNAQLAYPELDWMRGIQIWDADKQWLWPNLACLLRLHGVERVERYGGVDPGKGVDNDFAAVLIRKFSPEGGAESPDTVNAPLVAAEWYPVGVRSADKRTVVHEVESDEFRVHLRGSWGSRRETATIWLIYADFMGAKPPAEWPSQPEFAGGILACFKVEWALIPKQGMDFVVQEIVPPRGTGFDWERWVYRTRTSSDPKNTARFSDRPFLDLGDSSRPTSGVPRQTIAGSSATQPPIDRIVPSLSNLGPGWTSNRIVVLLDPLSSPAEFADQDKGPGWLAQAQKLVGSEGREAHAVLRYFRGTASALVWITRFKSKDLIRADWGRDASSTNTAVELPNVGEEARFYQRGGLHNNVAFRRGTYLVDVEGMSVPIAELQELAVALDRKLKEAAR